MSENRSRIPQKMLDFKSTILPEVPITDMTGPDYNKSEDLHPSRILRSHHKESCHTSPCNDNVARDSDSDYSLEKRLSDLEEESNGYEKRLTKVELKLVKSEKLHKNYPLKSLFEADHKLLMEMKTKYQKLEKINDGLKSDLESIKRKLDDSLKDNIDMKRVKLDTRHEPHYETRHYESHPLSYSSHENHHYEPSAHSHFDNHEPHYETHHYEPHPHSNSSCCSSHCSCGRHQY